MLIMQMWRTVILTTTLGLLLTVVALPARAVVIYPWCANYSGRGMGGAQNCGCFNQCLATVRGVGGTCGPNPLYVPYPPRPSYSPPIRR